MKKILSFANGKMIDSEWRIADSKWQADIHHTLYAITYVLVLWCTGALLLLLLSGCSKKEESIDKVNIYKTQSEKEYSSLKIYFCPLCGKKIDKKLYHRRPIACMIDNIKEARPQAGLSSACIIYEAPAEGRITRLMAIYLHEDANPIGPIRSVRPYFIDWALEYNAVLVHCGQSWEAFDRIYRLNLPTINEMWRKEAFFRVNYKKKPHNLFTSSYTLQKLIDEKQWQKYLQNDRFLFSEFHEVNQLNATEIKINYFRDYKVSYKYNPSDSLYTRFINNRPHIDSDNNKQIKVANIVIQFNECRKIDEEDRKDIFTVGFGKAIVINSGRKIEGEWFKRDIKSETVYFDKEDNIISFLPGKTFIQIVPKDTEIEIM